MRVEVQQAPFDPGEALGLFTQGHSKVGAVVSFTGLVRGDDDLREMHIEHYPAMTERALNQIAEQACRRWDLGDALVIHRFGVLRPGEVIMMVATAAAHRRAAFEAADFLMDYLKSRAPFWKKELRASGQGVWVAAKDADEAALRRWD